ncbi:bL17 family ribosomal protein [Thermogutta terrifontis]|uniref:bL17 family ribosomal protein n=1 Tax=Thermogutta terrifontis TaxID=1331910 RepID=UPI000BA882B2|nr:L17 family ribosomal protein [Thermogutta terrifontis]
MRHRKRGRYLGRSPSHRRALLRNLASALFLTEGEFIFEEEEPYVRGRIVTTLAKAKEVRPLVEKCITIAKRVLPLLEEAKRLEPTAPRNSEAWRAWRQSEAWYEWNRKMAPVVAARRRVLRLLGNNKEAMRIVFERVAPRFIDRPGGYTRIVRLAKRRVGDAGIRAILEFVGRNDRVKRRRTIKPEFESEPVLETPPSPPATQALEASQASSQPTEQSAGEQTNT